MENFKNICNYMMPEKILSDISKLNYLNYDDINVCHYVISQLSYTDNFRIKKGRIISLKSMKEKSLEEVRIFGDDIYSRVQDLLSTVPINRCNNIFDFQCRVGYDMDDKNNIIDPNSGKIDCYIVPRYLFEYCIFRLDHEHIHALKETNYEEYKNAFVLGEVIPMFFELIIFDPRNIIRRELVKDRLSSLNITKKNFTFVDEYIQNYGFISFNSIDGDDYYQQRSIYEYLRTRDGCYLNSFYYALILYNMYKENPKKILDFVSRVLKQEITTLDMLNCLGIYGDINGGTFEKELGLIRKLLK